MIPKIAACLEALGRGRALGPPARWPYAPRACCSSCSPPTGIGTMIESTKRRRSVTYATRARGRDGRVERSRGVPADAHVPRAERAVRAGHGNRALGSRRTSVPRLSGGPRRSCRSDTPTTRSPTPSPSRRARSYTCRTCTAPSRDADVARTLDRLFGGGGQVFFCNSGAEANEAALKLARKWGGHGRYQVVSAYGSFHGRTLATLHATGQPQKHEPFQPLPEGFRHVAWDDLDALASAIDPSVAAVLLEPVQGEGGVNPATTEYFAGRARAVRRARRAVHGRRSADRTRTYRRVVRASTLRGRPRCRHDGQSTRERHADRRVLGDAGDVAAAFEPGDHATTFGGQPLAAAAARAVLAIMERDDAPGLAVRAGPAPDRWSARARWRDARFVVSACCSPPSSRTASTRVWSRRPPSMRVWS